MALNSVLACFYIDFYYRFNDHKACTQQGYSFNGMLYKQKSHKGPMDITWSSVVEQFLMYEFMCYSNLDSSDNNTVLVFSFEITLFNFLWLTCTNNEMIIVCNLVRTYVV